LIYSSLRRSVKETLAPGLIHIFILDPLSNHYIATVDESGLPTSDLRYHPNSPFVQFLAKQHRPFIFDASEIGQHPLSSERARLALLGASLFIPLPGQQQLVGWLAMGTRQSGESYHNSEIAYLESICSQAALAIERLQVITNLEGRVREMDALTRIAQGVNITLDFDNILELIYAQTNLVIPVHDFRITLRDPNDGKYSYVLFVENDERVAYNENISISPRQGLEAVVIQNQRAVITPDYQNECRSQGIIPNTPGVIAWMGVPLHAGSKTIGCISLGSRDPATLFTQHQRDLLQAIADQAAGAIIKSQLLAESDRRARQLAALNEVGRSLTSTLDINTLLKQILSSAVELLNCEAGSLYTIEAETNDIVVEVTIGPGAGDIAGTHLPARSGVIGSVMETGQPVIVNSGTSSQDFSGLTETQNDIYQRDLLAVPMKVKETTIGVIEVINKLNGTPFDEDDQGILSTFSSQAAVALENARLYTQTDEALSARLEEMSVMQRIDRELNTSLDVGKTMRITLDWSLRQSKSDSGLIGFVEWDEQASTPNIRIIASQGLRLSQSSDHLPADNTEEQAELMTASLPAIQKVVREGLPLRSEFDESNRMSSAISSSSIASALNNADINKLSPSAKAQIIIPIRRKSDVIGILLLESANKDRYSPDTNLFLTRLCDHAAIAISNAQLYEDLQAANIAKSEFVSLVSHELKTPMTSIRGYADLLAQGTVGPINEIQGNFLNTIRSNVNRMANLVSDLADVSRIEAGKLRLEFGEVSITEIIHEVINSTQAFLNEKEQVLVLDLPDDSPLVWADYNRLIQILNNLVSNAIKYTPQGGHITINAGKHQNEWDSKGAPQVVKLSVIDTGYGISPEEQVKIFQKFFRSSDPNIRDVPGTGLGLNITRHLVEMQGGRIWFSSQVGTGSVFHFTIPVAATT
jgi:signal transduction histidine kinase